MNTAIKKHQRRKEEGFLSLLKGEQDDFDATSDLPPDLIQAYKDRKKIFHVDSTLLPPPKETFSLHFLPPFPN